MSKPLAPDAILQLGMGFWASKTLLSAVSLGLFSTLAKGPLTHPEIRQRLGLHDRGSRDFLDALVALQMLRRDGERYSNSPETDLFLDRAKPSYIGGILEMMDRRLFQHWNRLTDGLKTGLPQNEARDGQTDVFATIYADPTILRNFLGAMTGVSRMTAKAIASTFDWSTVKTFVDIGCAQGGCTVEIAAAHPHLTGIGFDLAPVGPVFKEFVEERKLGDRLRFEAGNFFDQPIPSADVLVMGHILHDWDLAEKQMLLAKAYEALPVGGSLIVYDAMIDDDRRENAFGLLMSLNMLIETKGGFDYSGADCLGWMRGAGFRSAAVTRLTPTHAMAVAVK